MTSFDIMAPLSGWCATLDEVPDPVFAGRILGDGMAIDPTVGLLLAPCAGEIVTLPASAHAVSIRTAHGVEVLVHIGIDTVTLGGRGFEGLAQPGGRVAIGEPLIRFDLDLVVRGAKSLMTPVVVSYLEGMTLTRRRASGPVSAGEPLFEVNLSRTPPQPVPAQPVPPQPVPPQPERTAAVSPAVQRTLHVALRHGLHARPAALLGQRAKTFESQITLGAHGRTANARSVAAIMALGVRHDDELRIEARGADAVQAVAGVIAALGQALNSESAASQAAASATAATAKTAPAAPPGVPAPAVHGALRGIIAVPGFAIGQAARLERRVITVEEFGADALHERAELERARTHVRSRLQRGAAGADTTRREIIEAHLEFIDDPSLIEPADALIATGKSAGFAWRTAVSRSIEALQVLEDPRLRERVDDLLDVQSQVLLALAGDARPSITPLPERAVVIAQDLLPSEFTALDRERLAAICLGAGGATSHVAILAAALQVPMLVGLGDRLQEIRDGSTVIVDADHGLMQTAPGAIAVAQARTELDTRLARRNQLRIAAHADCHARDGTRIEVFANLGNVSDAANAVANGAEGCGLLRTEFLFLERDTAPTEEEQREAYQDIARVLDGRPMILRLMDVGGDKPLRYLPLPAEENPALGLRGIRTALARPDLLRAQLRAALQVQPLGSMRLLLPMITDIAEILAVRAMVDAEMAALRIPGGIHIGAMIETPASALIAERLIGDVDFLSIGSNDLTQYTLAMDRGHAQLAERTDALHPAVLKLIAAAAAAAVSHGKLVAVCGGVAADPLAVPLLLGLGVRELSVVPGAIPALKRQVRGISMLDCRDLALRCLELSSAAEVRALASQTASSWGDAV